MDEAKQDAVRAALGSRDFTLVQGPPGTGKATFITEFVCQLKSMTPDARVLLSSQTHVAVDNAAVRLSELRPDLVIIRIGGEEKLGADARGLSVGAQLNRWGREVAVHARAYLTNWAIHRGISPEAHRAYVDAQEADLTEQKLSRVSDRLEALDKDEERILDRLTDPTVTTTASAEVADLGDQLAALQDERELRLQDRARLERDAATVTARLADHLGVGSLVEVDVRRELEARFPVKTSDLEDFSKLSALQEEWILRFGQGHEFTRALIARADVVAGTCVGLSSVVNDSEMDFEVAIVDEASKATPTEALIPMGSSKRWILVGDTRQLPPFVEVALAQSGFLEAHELSGDDLGETVFARLVDQVPGNVVSLTHQHRMLRPIGELVSECSTGGGSLRRERARVPSRLSGAHFRALLCGSPPPSCRSVRRGG